MWQSASPNSQDWCSVHPATLGELLLQVASRWLWIPMKKIRGSGAYQGRRVAQLPRVLPKIPCQESSFMSSSSIQGG